EGRLAQRRRGGREGQRARQGDPPAAQARVRAQLRRQHRGPRHPRASQARPDRRHRLRRLRRQHRAQVLRVGGPPAGEYRQARGARRAGARGLRPRPPLPRLLGIRRRAPPRREGGDYHVSRFVQPERLQERDPGSRTGRREPARRAHRRPVRPPRSRDLLMTLRPFAEIASLGTAVPEQVVPNHDLSRTLDTSDAWIVERTGIRERRIARADESLASLCVSAADKAMGRAGVDADELDAIVLATVSPDRRMPGTACDVQALLGANNAAAFDIAAACPGFLYRLGIAEGCVATGTSRTVLVLGAEKLSCITDWQDRATAVLFGDGAGAAVVRPAS